MPAQHIAAHVGPVFRRQSRRGFRIGLSNQILQVRGFAEKLAKQAPVAIRLAKVLLNRSGDIPIDAALEMEAMAFGLISSTEDIYEGLQAFMEKREPKFKGE